MNLSIIGMNKSSILLSVIAGLTGIILGMLCLFIPNLSSQWMPYAVLAVLFPFLLSIVGNIKKVLLALILFDIPFRIDYYFGYSDKAVAYGAIVGFGISITTICLIGLYALWITELLSKRHFPQRILPSSYLPLLFYLIFVMLSVFVAKDKIYSFYEIFMLVQMFLLFLYVIGTVHTQQDVIFIIAMLLIGLVLESLIMIWIRLTGHGFSFAGIKGTIDIYGSQSRIGGTLGSPIIAASYLELLITPAFSILLTKLNTRYKFLAILAFGLGGVSLILTFSRASWLGFFLSMTMILLFSCWRGWLPLKIPVIAIVSVGILWLFFHDPISQRLFGNDLGSSEARIPLMLLAFRIIKDHPFLGVGANNFGLVLTQYVTPDLGLTFLYDVHNKFLLVWAENGIGGLISFSLFLALTIRRGWQVWKSDNRFLATVGLGLVAAVIGQIPHMFVDVFHSRTQVQLLWIISGLILAIYSMDSEQ